jgi:AraC family transcriptional regulator of adaptative response / DNA-3-methyladenine glycosylase II
VLLDHDRCYRAVASRDARFDGCFVVTVRTTGIYCRPSCPAMTPKPGNVTFLPTAAAAQLAGYRACRRCLPDAVPGSPEWNLRGDLVARAVRLIGDGLVERAGVPGLAARLGYSTRQLNRVLTAELGAGALALARAHRAQAARVLVQTTALPLADVAFAAGFASVRQFNATIQTVYATTPSELRRQVGVRPVPGAVTLRLAFRAPMDSAGLLEFLAARAVPGVECSTGNGGYARTLRLPHGCGSATLRVTAAHWDATLRLGDLRDLPVAVSRLRRLLDADADPCAVDEVLGADPALAAAVSTTPGIRVPGTVDGAETVLRAVLGQQVSVAAARTAAARLTAALGEPIDGPEGLSRLFPAPAAVAEHAAEVLTGPRRRIEAVRAVAVALASGELVVDAGRAPDELRTDLQAIPGIGPWTAGYVTMRVLGATDLLLDTDLALRRGAAALGLPTDVAGLRRRAQRWAPWRSYAGMQLWRAAANAPPHRTEQTA